MTKTVRDDSIVKSLLILSMPTILEQILQTLFQYVDTAMVGHLGEQATSSVSITTTINWLIGSFISAIGVAAIAIISRQIGANNQKKVTTVSKQLLLLAAVIGLSLGIISCALSPFIPQWMGAETNIQKDAGIYFFIISLPMIFRAGNSIFGYALRATKDTKTPLYVNLCANACNIVLNYILIYVCSLGVTGAAIASAISYTFAGTAMFIAYRRNAFLRYDMKDFCIHAGQIREIFKIALPVLLTGITSCFGYVMFAALVSGLGTHVFAAHSLAVTAEQLFYIPGYGLRTATSTMIGNSLGERDHKKFRLISHYSIVITLFMMLISGLVLYFAAYPIMCLFTSSKSVATLGSEMLRIVAFSEPFFGLMIVVEGILYGMGQTKPPFYIETIGMWCIRILFTFFCVSFWGFGLTAVWICMIADNIFKAVCLFAYFRIKVVPKS